MSPMAARTAASARSAAGLRRSLARASSPSISGISVQPSTTPSTGTARTAATAARAASVSAGPSRPPPRPGSGVHACLQRAVDRRVADPSRVQRLDVGRRRAGEAEDADVPPASPRDLVHRDVDHAEDRAPRGFPERGQPHVGGVAGHDEEVHGPAQPGRRVHQLRVDLAGTSGRSSASTRRGMRRRYQTTIGG